RSADVSHNNCVKSVYYVNGTPFAESSPSCPRISLGALTIGGSSLFRNRIFLQATRVVGPGALAILGAGHAGIGYANEAPAAPEETVPADAYSAEAGGIVVTAQRREERLQDVPVAVTALDRNLFTVGGLGRSANEVLNLVPNASAGTQQHGRPRWWIRGVGAGQQQLDLASPVGFYLDDVYISNASATGLPLFDLERVEVLRGPQGTLWGK